MSSNRSLIRIALCAAAAVAWAAPFLLDAAEPLVFVCLVPFFVLVGSGRFGGVLLPSYGVGFLYTALGIGWLWKVWVPLPVLTGAYFGIFALLFGWALQRVLRATGLPLIAVAPPLFVAMEFLRTYVSIFRTTWLHLAYPLHDWTTLIQISRWTGHLGVTFVVVLVNAAVTEAVLSYWKGRKILTPRVGIAVGTAAFVLLSALALGGSVPRPASQRAGPTFGIAQPSFPLKMMINPRRWNEVLRGYIDLTRERGGDGIDLWLWSESAYPGRVQAKPQALAAIRAMTSDLSTPVLLGSIGAKMLRGQRRPTNSAFLVLPDGAIGARYDKRVLVPFGETIPILGRFQSLRKPISDYLHRAVGFRPHIAEGEDADPFPLSWGGREVRIGPLICYEDILPDLARRSRLAGAQILVNISNESWFPEKEQDQHLAMAKFRAVENGVPLLRATSTGISCVISQRGEVVAVIERDGRTKGVAGILVERVPLPSDSLTLYSAWGEVFCGALFILAAALWVGAWRRQRK